ncbi:30S ribosomal protein S20 [Candidatus Peregrinibacteria bacterium]|nr:30S ribosomal protein S20 [Candidatus Peregrinibacteria bacterium]
MPIIQSSIKRARQNERHRLRLLPYRTQMKTMIRSALDLVTLQNIEEARAILPRAYKAIDTAAKKKIISFRTASRRKSRLARAVQAASAPSK